MKTFNVPSSPNKLILLVTAALWPAPGVHAKAPTAIQAALTIRPAGREGFDVLVNGKLVAPIRLSTNGAITARKVKTKANSIRLSGLQCKDPRAVTFAPDDYVSISWPATTHGGAQSAPQVRFNVTLRSFNAPRWQALFPGGVAPFHFLSCSMPTAQVWHQRGWLNATPNADPFPLLGDVHVNEPEISCKWNRNWSYICPLGAHPIPMIGAWDPPHRLYVGYDFQEARATDQSERYISTTYCWRQGNTKSFITLAYPYGGLRYGELVYPKGGEVVNSHFRLIVDTNLPDTEDPNERFQQRLFAHYADALPRVPAMNDLSWLPGGVRLKDFEGPIGLGLWGPGSESTFYGEGTTLIYGWGGQREMPVDTAVRRGDKAGLASGRAALETLLQKYAKHVTVDGDDCLFWEKPLSGSWHPSYGGLPVTTMHNSDAWYPARVLVELYRYDRSRGQANPEYLRAIDGIFNWTKHFVWTRNEFADVPSSPFAIGGTLSTAFLLDYYFTFRDDPQRGANAALALKLADHVIWRYLPIWAMDSDRSDGALDSSFLIEPNSGRDWAGLACANEVHWMIDSLTQVYVHTGDPRMLYYLRGILQRWPQLYRNAYEDSLADYGHDAMTEGLGFFDGSGPGRGGRYTYGSADALPMNEPVGNSKLRVVAGIRSAVAFCKDGAQSDIGEYHSSGPGACRFRVISSLPGAFDVSFSYPYVDVSRAPVYLTRNGQMHQLQEAEVRRPPQSPSSLYIVGPRNGDTVSIGSNNVPVGRASDTTPPLAYHEVGAFLSASATAQSFRQIPLTMNYRLTQDWNDLQSFAGIIPGERWAYGVPYVQTTRAASGTVAVKTAGARTIFVAYAPPSMAAMDQAPSLILDSGRELRLSGKPAPAWRSWPPIFQSVVLLDYAVVPPGRTAVRIHMNGTLLMAATAVAQPSPDLAATKRAMVGASAKYAQEVKTMRGLLALKARFAPLPAGRMAILPGATASAGAAFSSITGLHQKSLALTPEQLIDPQQFSAARFPVAFAFGGERYIKTVRTPGDAQAAIVRYLAEGGTLIVIASAPFPLYYADGPDGKQGGPDPVFRIIGLPVGNAFETAPSPLTMHRNLAQNIVQSVPETFPFPTGDPRLRSINRAQVDPANTYTPIISVQDAAGKDYGDAACYIEFGTGPAKGGKLLYVWSTLAESPYGNAIIGDAMTWVLGKALK